MYDDDLLQGADMVAHSVENLTDLQTCILPVDDLVSSYSPIQLSELYPITGKECFPSPGFFLDPLN